MARDKEFALKHALVAVLAAAMDLGVGDQVIAKATAGCSSRISTRHSRRSNKPQDG
jgi:hypothetical protein